jgi:hypothetical protein
VAPQEGVDPLLGGATTETLARILAGLFDGDAASRQVLA